MKQASRHSLAAALLVAVALHGAGAVVLAWCIASGPLPHVSAGACVVDVSFDSVKVEEEKPTSVRPHPAGWIPQQPQAAEMDLTAPPPPELPVPSTEHTVPQCVVAPLETCYVAVDSTAAAAVVAPDVATSGASAAPGFRADSGSHAGTNEVARTVADAGANAGLVMSGTVRPRYPASARLRGEQGLVAVTVETDDEGRARQVTVTAPSGFPALDRAALDAARRARFVSAVAGTPARGKASLSFRFNLVD